MLAHRLSLLATYAGALEYRPDAPPEQLAHILTKLGATNRTQIALLAHDAGLV